MQYTSSQSGFTLLELLLYVAIIGSLLTGISMFFAGSAAMGVKNQAENEVASQATMALEQIIASIRNADSITSPAVGVTANQLTLAVPTAAASPTIFSVVSGTLQMKEGTAAAIPLTSSGVTVTNLQFKRAGAAGTPGSVQVLLTLNKASGGERDEFTFTDTFIGTGTVRP